MDAEDDTKWMSERNWGEIREQLGMFRVIPIRGKLIWRADVYRLSVELESFCWLKPGLKRLFRNLLASSVKDSRPDFWG
jgi:hypothetical protein